MLGLTTAAALLLLVAGAPKALDPTTTHLALVRARLPGPPALSSAAAVRASGVAEVGVALVVLVAGGRAAAGALGLVYLLLAGVAARMLAVAPDQGCGCFGASGAEEPPVSRAHVAVDLGLALVGLVAAGTGVPSLVAALGSAPGSTAALVVLAALLSWGAYLLMTVLPGLLRLAVRVEVAR